MSILVKLITQYYEKRGLKWPDFNDAMKFVITEIAEVFEEEMAGKGYIRNNPEQKPTQTSLVRLEEELADVMMMVQVAGMYYNLDPLRCLVERLLTRIANLGSKEE